MAEARIIYLATNDGLIQLANPGRSDRWRDVGRSLGGQPVGVVAAAPSDPLLAAAVTEHAVCRTTNGGMSWDEIWEGSATAITFDSDGALLIGTRDGMVLRQRSDEGWHPIVYADDSVKQIVVLAGDQIVACGSRTVCQLKMPDAAWRVPFASDVDVIGVTINPTAPEHAVVVAQARQGLSSATFTGALVVLGGNDPVLLLGTDGLLLRLAAATSLASIHHEAGDMAMQVIMIDQGALLSYQQVAGPSNVSAVVTPPRYLDQAFAGTRSGELWFSADRGRTWAMLRSDLPAISDLAFARAM